MCGIAGAVSLRGERAVDAGVVRRMTDALQHRGPDGCGFFNWPDASPRISLGMRRLAILDLVTGDQPVFSEDQSVVAVCNGEIYNYRELRADLIKCGHVFRSLGDTEVLVHLYEQHGLNLFDRLRGMYAFALWDAHAERLVLAVDHLGIKPLYVLTCADHWRFASEAKALLVDSSVPREPRIESIDAYLTFGYAVGETTLFHGIERMAPGTAYIVEGGRAELKRHWKPACAAGSAGSIGSSVREGAIAVRQALREAISFHLRSDVPLGLFLSGGIDSAGLLALMREELPRVRTFTVGYDGELAARHDEAAAARAIAAWAGSDHTEHRMSACDWWDALGNYVIAHDEPNANASMVALYALADVAAGDVRVVLNGTGGDELFGGYPFHAQLPLLLRRATARQLSPVRTGLARALAVGEPWYPRLRRWPLAARVPQLASRTRSALLPPDEALRRVMSFEALVLNDHLRDQLYGAPLRAARREPQIAADFRRILDEAVADAGPAEENVVQTLVMRLWLPGNGLLSLDKVTMAHGLEARVPYFDRSVLETVFGLPPASRLADGKRLLREALAGALPDRFRTRRKQPFETPLVTWLDTDLAGQVRSVLLDPGARIRAVFDMAALERMLDRQAARRAEHAELILRLVILELWWRWVSTS